MTRRTERTLWIVTVLFAIAAIIAARWPLHVQPAALDTGLRTPAPLMTFDADRFTAADERTVSKNPFRLERRPSDVAFGDPVATSPTPRPPSPTQGLSLKGIVGGPPWQAVLAGVPGRTGNVVVQPGDTLGGLRVRRIRHDGVEVVGPDSLIRLTVQRAWQ